MVAGRGLFPTCHARPRPFTVPPGAARAETWTAWSTRVAGTLARLQMHHRAGQGARNPVDGLDSRHDQLAEGVDVARLGADDHVVRPGQRIGVLHAVDLRGCPGDLPRLADFGLDEDIGGDHLALPRKLVVHSRISRGVPRGRRVSAKMWSGCPPTPESSLGREPVDSVWRWGFDLDGSRTVLGARRSEFRFPTEAPGRPWIWPMDGRRQTRRCGSRRRSRMRSTNRPGSGWPRSMWPRRRGWCAPGWRIRPGRVGA